MIFWQQIQIHIHFHAYASFFRFNFFSFFIIKTDIIAKKTIVRYITFFQEHFVHYLIPHWLASFTFILMVFPSGKTFSFAYLPLILTPWARLFGTYSVSFSDTSCSPSAPLLAHFRPAHSSALVRRP